MTLITTFKRSIRPIILFSTIICTAFSYANTGIFDTLAQSNNQYYDHNRYIRHQFNTYLKATQNATDLNPSEKTMLLQILQHQQKVEESDNCGSYDNESEFFDLYIPAHIKKSKELINLPALALIKYNPTLFYYNNYLCHQAEQAYHQNKAHWDKELKKTHNTNKSPMLALIKILKPKNFQWQTFTNKSGTLLEQQLMNCIYVSKNDTFDMYGEAAHIISGMLLDNTLTAVIQAEKILHAQGYETFFHARSWTWNFVNDVCNLVTSIHNPAHYHANKHLLRFRPPNCDTDILYQYRQQLIDIGPGNYVNSGFNHTGAQQEVTCMNKTILSNITYCNWGECTGEYYFNNYSQAGRWAAVDMLEKIIKEYDLIEYFKKYASNIKQLITMHQQLHEHGELLCIAIKKEYVTEMVYAAVPGGLKYPKTVPECIQQERQAFLNQEYIDDETSCHFYCFAVSDIPGEYNKKYFIQSLCTGNPQLYAQYCAQRDELFAKIKEEYIQDHN